ncbi:hypothetical protein MANI_026191 [Metarhizium anisopliae]|nr:hypothetical protein MANI_026191 [Metarhizium anisopliae]
MTLNVLWNFEVGFKFIIFLDGVLGGRSRSCAREAGLLHVQGTASGSPRSRRGLAYHSLDNSFRFYKAYKLAQKDKSVHSYENMNSVNWTAFGYCLIVSRGAILFRLDTSPISGIIIINKFQEDFGDLDPVTGAFFISAGGQTLR